MNSNSFEEARAKARGERCTRMSRGVPGAGGARGAWMMPACVGLVWLAGCAAGLPQERWTGHADALATMAARGRTIETLSARCRVILERPGDRTVELSAAFVAEPPDRYRLRAWKMTEAVLDMTVTADGVWLWSKDGGDGAATGDAARVGLFPADVPTAHLREGLNMALGFVDEGPWLAVACATRPDEVILQRTVSAVAPGFTETNSEEIGRRDATRESEATPSVRETLLRCTMHMPTRTVIRYELVDADGETRFTLAMDRYRAIGEAVLPARLQGRADDHAFTLLLHDVEINTGLPVTAFQPPPRAVKR